MFSAFFYYNIFKLYGKSILRDTSYVHIPKNLNKNVVLLSLLPLVGLMLLIYDRVFLRGIDYAHGLRHARYEWLASEGGSLFGIIGNLIVPIGYVGIFFAIRYISVLRHKQLAILMSSGFIAVLGIAVLNGGRSNILLLIILALIGFSKNKRKIKIKLNFFNKVFLFILLALSIFYVFKIMESSAELGSVEFSQIAELGIGELYGKPDEIFFSKEHTGVVYKIIYAFAYLFHGQWTTQVIYGLSDTLGYYSVVAAPTVFLDKLGILNLGLRDVAFVATGPFVSLLGAIYYDFRWWGIIIWGMMLGGVFGLVLFFLNNNNRFGTFKAILIISVSYVLILSPIGPAYGFSHYSFIILAFLIVDVLNRIIIKQKIQY